MQITSFQQATQYLLERNYHRNIEAYSWLLARIKEDGENRAAVLEAAKKSLVSRNHRTRYLSRMLFENLRKHGDFQIYLPEVKKAALNCVKDENIDVRRTGINFYADLVGWGIYEEAIEVAVTHSKDHRQMSRVGTHIICLLMRLVERRQGIEEAAQIALQHMSNCPPADRGLTLELIENITKKDSKNEACMKALHVFINLVFPEEAENTTNFIKEKSIPLKIAIHVTLNAYNKRQERTRNALENMLRIGVLAESCF
jgi:hypothetical protein